MLQTVNLNFAGEARPQMTVADTQMTDVDHHPRDAEDHHPKGNIAEDHLLMTAAEAQMTGEAPHQREGGDHLQMATVVTTDEDLHRTGVNPRMAIVVMIDKDHRLTDADLHQMTEEDRHPTGVDLHQMIGEDHLVGCRISGKGHQTMSKL